MNKLYFVRHGLSEMNKQGKWSGTSETPLSPEGRRQAREAGKQAKDLGIDYIVSSPLSRAYETAKIIAKQIGYPAKDIHRNSLFVERHWGSLEGETWSPDIDIDGIADVETVDNVLKRARLALDFLETLEQDTVLVVSHGSFGRALRHHLLEDFPYSSRSVPGTKIHNAQIIQLL